MYGFSTTTNQSPFIKLLGSVSCDVNPAQNSVQNLGTSTRKWNTLYCDNIVTAGGATGSIFPNITLTNASNQINMPNVTISSLGPVGSETLYIPDVSGTTGSTNFVLSDANRTLNNTTTSTGQILVTNTTASTTPITGALIVSGGIGCTGAISTNGINITGTASTSGSAIAIPNTGSGQGITIGGITNGQGIYLANGSGGTCIGCTVANGGIGLSLVGGTTSTPIQVSGANTSITGSGTITSTNTTGNAFYAPSITSGNAFYAVGTSGALLNGLVTTGRAISVSNTSNTNPTIAGTNNGNSDCISANASAGCAVRGTNSTSGNAMVADASTGTGTAMNVIGNSTSTNALTVTGSNANISANNITGTNSVITPSLNLSAGAGTIIGTTAPGSVQTLTIPTGSASSATFVLDTSTNTMTNKTLTNPTLSGTMTGGAISANVSAGSGVGILVNGNNTLPAISVTGVTTGTGINMTTITSGTGINITTTGGTGINISGASASIVGTGAILANNMSLSSNTYPMIFQPNGTGNSFSIGVAGNPAANRTISLPDPGGNANFILSTSSSTQTITGSLAVTGGITGNRPIGITNSSSTYTFVLTDANTFIQSSSASATTLTIPLNASVAFPLGTEIDICQTGAGKVTFASSATINSVSSLLSIGNQYTCATLKKVATDTWLLNGNLSS